MIKGLRSLQWLILSAAMFSCAERNDSSSSKVSVFNTTEGSQVEKLLHDYYKTMSARKWQTYRNYFWPGATITTAWLQPGDSVETVDVTTIDDFIRETPMGPDSQPVFEEKMIDSRIEVQGDMANAWVSYEAAFGKPDSLMRWKGTDLFTLLRHKGEWKIVSLVFESKEE